MWLGHHHPHQRHKPGYSSIFGGPPSRRQSWHGTKSSAASSGATYLTPAASGHNLQLPTTAPGSRSPSPEHQNPAAAHRHRSPVRSAKPPSTLTTSTTVPEVPPITFDTVQEALDWMARGNHANITKNKQKAHRHTAVLFCLSLCLLPCLFIAIQFFLRFILALFWVRNWLMILSNLLWASPYILLCIVAATSLT